MKRFVAKPYDATVYITTDHVEYVKICKRLADFDPDGEPAGESFHSDVSEHVIGVFDGELKTAVHESVHTGMAICKDVQIDPKEHSGEEALAYLVAEIWLEVASYMARKKAGRTAKD